jgi:hypothetical protein
MGALPDAMDRGMILDAGSRSASRDVSPTREAAGIWGSRSRDRGGRDVELSGGGGWESGIRRARKRNLLVEDQKLTTTEVQK